MKEEWDTIYARFANEIEDAEEILGREFSHYEGPCMLLFLWEAQDGLENAEVEAPRLDRFIKCMKDGYKFMYDEGGHEAKRLGIGQIVRQTGQNDLRTGMNVLRVV